MTTLTSGTLPTSCTDTQNVGNIMDRGYNFNYGSGDNGNVMAITNYRDTTRSQAFTYDALNRLASGWSSANTGAYSWGENYSIDAWGNLQISPMGTKAHGGSFQLSGNAQNRPTGLAYDAAGNLLSYLTANYTYDQENRLSSTAGMSYTYDGNGERVLKSNTSTGAAVKRYWSMGGNTLAEGDGSGNLTAEYVYFGGKRVARIDLPANTVHYYLSDHLGSTSIVASAAGAIEEESDYYPFGTEVIVTSGVNELKFTGKRRDTESQLDYFGARHYSNVFGRFASSDEPLADQDELNPQSWNLYSYVRNNPLIAIDPDGRAVLVCSNTGNGQSCGWVSDEDYKKARDADSRLGINAPGGNKPEGDVTCGGQVCGSVTWAPGSPSDHTGPDNGALIPGSLGPGDLLVFGIGRSLLGSSVGEAAVEGSAAGTAGRGLLTGTEGVLLSNGTKAAAKDIVEGMAEGAQKASLKRALGAAGSQAKITVQKAADGSVRVMINRAGTEGGQTIVKTVAVDGSSKTVQLAVDGAGKLVHYDPKN
jgi:RHS repeat-associated protein